LGGVGEAADAVQEEHGECLVFQRGDDVAGAGVLEKLGGLGVLVGFGFVGLVEDRRALWLHRPPGRLRLRKLRGKRLLNKPGRTRRYHVPPLAARTIAALLTLRDQVITPILAAVRSPRMGRKPAYWTRVDRDYERIRIDMQTLFNDLAIETPLAA
jgi:hypothetical protein